MTEQPRSPRRRLYIVLAGAALIFLPYSIAWRIAAAEMKQAVYDWVDAQRAAGLEVEHGAVAAGGFPFFLCVRVETPRIAAPGAWSWRGERLRIDAAPWNFSRLDFAPRGEQSLWASGFGEWRAGANDVDLGIAADRNRGWVFTMKIADGAMTRESDGADVKVGALELALNPAAEDASTLSLTLALTDLKAAVSGEVFMIDSLQADLVLSQTSWLVPPDPAAQWRAADGALTVEMLTAETGGARLSAEGTLRLDENLQPEGLLHAEVVNPAELAPLLAQTGALTTEEARSAAASLTLMAIAGGGKIAAPVEIENGAASIGGVKIADLPRVE